MKNLDYHTLLQQITDCQRHNTTTIYVSPRFLHDTRSLGMQKSRKWPGLLSHNLSQSVARARGLEEMWESSLLGRRSHTRFSQLRQESVSAINQDHQAIDAETRMWTEFIGDEELLRARVENYRD